MMKFCLCRLTIGIVLAAGLFAQETATRETLLRERVNTFWTAFEEAKYRKADALVLEEDKDDFYAWSKKKIFKIEKSDIKFTEDGKIAEVMTSVETDEFMVGVGQMRITRPVLTYWKFKEDSWWWHQPKNVLRETPFGLMNLGGADGAKGGTVAMSPRAMTGPSIAELWKMVQPNKTEISFNLDKAASEKIEFRNQMNGAVGLILDVPPREEFQVSVEPKEIPRGGVGVVTVKYTPTPQGGSQPLKPGIYDLRVTVAQTGKTHTIQMKIAEPLKAVR